MHEKGEAIKSHALGHILIANEVQKEFFLPP